MTQLQEIYSTYETRLAEAAKSDTLFSGAFGMGNDSRTNACNDLFYEAVGQWTSAFSGAHSDAYEAAAWILSYPAQHRRERTYWFSYAAQKHAICLISSLTSEEAAKLLKAFTGFYPKEEWLPVQKELVSALRKAAGEKASAPKVNFWQLWGIRVILLLVGLTIAHLGVTLFLLADLGSDPFNVMIQGLTRMVSGSLSLTHGNIHVAVSLLIVAVLLVVDRSYVRIGTFLCMILGGPIIDVFTLLLAPIVSSTSSMVIRIAAVVLGCAILAFGMTIVIKSEAGTGPNDLVAVVISDKGKWKFGLIRIAVDIGFALIGFLLGGTVGVGTLVCLAVVGPVAQIFMPFSEKICRSVMKLQKGAPEK